MVLGVGGNHSVTGAPKPCVTHINGLMTMLSD